MLNIILNRIRFYLEMPLHDTDSFQCVMECEYADLWDSLAKVCQVTSPDCFMNLVNSWAPDSDQIVLASFIRTNTGTFVHQMRFLTYILLYANNAHFSSPKFSINDRMTFVKSLVATHEFEFAVSVQINDGEIGLQKELQMLCIGWISPFLSLNPRSLRYVWVLEWMRDLLLQSTAWSKSSHTLLNAQLISIRDSAWQSSELTTLITMYMTQPTLFVLMAAIAEMEKYPVAILEFSKALSENKDIPRFPKLEIWPSIKLSSQNIAEFKVIVDLMISVSFHDKLQNPSKSADIDSYNKAIVSIFSNFGQLLNRAFDASLRLDWIRVLNLFMYSEASIYAISERMLLNVTKQDR